MALAKSYRSLEHKIYCQNKSRYDYYTKKGLPLPDDLKDFSVTRRGKLGRPKKSAEEIKVVKPVVKTVEVKEDVELTKLQPSEIHILEQKYLAMFA